MAYVDGELEGHLADDIRKAIEADPEVLKRVEIFRESAAVLQGVYDAPLQEPVPERLIKTVMDSNTDTSSSGLLKFISIFFPMPSSWKFAYATVASLALLIGIGIGYLSTNTIPPKGNLYSLIINGRDFSQGLDTTISGKSFETADNTIKVTPISTFMDKAHHYCRQYEAVSLRNQKGSLLWGIACRDKTGNWHTTVLISPPSSADLQVGTNKGYIRASANDLIDTITSSLMATPPMTLEQEAKLIKKAWPENRQR